jgi:hypothetical protein
MSESFKQYNVESMTGLEVYKIGREAIITLQPSTGYVSVSCPWHGELNGCHWWNARGDESFHDFLVSLNRDYAMDKLFRDLKEFDLEETINNIKHSIIRNRRNGDWPRDVARDLWDDLVSCETIDDIARLSDPYGNCYYEDIRYKYKHCVDWFWDNIWAAFIDHLKSLKTKQLNQKTANSL